MILYPCQQTNEYYDAFKVVKAKRTGDHPSEPSWGTYVLETGARVVLCDCDYDDAQDRIFTHRGTTWLYEGVEE